MKIVDLHLRPEYADAEQRFIKKWMENISNDVGDAFGETIPAKGTY